MKKRYVEVGTGGRARFWYEAIAGRFADTCELVGICDVSETRMQFCNRILTEKYHQAPAKMYKYTEFDTMLDELHPDYVIVTSVDRTHADYIIRAMEHGVDVITEKPMTIDEDKAQAILDTQKQTGRDLRVTFNYRYAPHNSKLAEILRAGTIGDIYSVHFEWLLNTKHGADYFRRWHRNKYNSGGLLVHKATHHFDLVNFWLQSFPDTVFAQGSLNFYGMKNAEKRGVEHFYYRAHGSEYAKNDPFAIDLESSPDLKGLYLDAEADSGYIRDRSVFSDDISIEDTMGVLVRYHSGAIMTYSLNAYEPWEGFNVVFNGSKGRVEMKVIEQTYINAGGDFGEEGATKGATITVHPMFGKPYDVPIETTKGGHGGGDPILQEDIFGDPAPDPLHRAAGSYDGAMSILTGIAANKSIASGMPIKVADLLQF